MDIKKIDQYKSGRAIWYIISFLHFNEFFINKEKKKLINLMLCALITLLKGNSCPFSDTH